jgi:hypothetical protein
MKAVQNPADDLRREKLRIALTRQISRWGWRLMMQALQSAAERGAEHQKANPAAAELWQWRAEMFRQLARRESVPATMPEPPPETSAPS